MLYAGAEKNPLNLNQVMLAEESGTGRHLSDAPLTHFLHRPIWLMLHWSCYEHQIPVSHPHDGALRSGNRRGKAHPDCLYL